MEVYRKGQGNHARALVAIVAGLFVVFGVSEAFESFHGTSLYVITALIVVVIGGGGIFASFFYKKTAEFLIDTEAEMKKVAWPPWGEVKGSTGVVITTVIIMGAFLYTVDYTLGVLTQWIGVFPKV